MPKKPVRNAFYFFMKDLEPQLKREGRVLRGMQDIVPIAHPRWKVLPEAEKQRYEKIAKEYKAKMRGAEGDRYRLDNTGKLLSERVDEHAETQKRRSKERNSVKSQWPTGKLVAEEKFYLLNVQTLCKTEEGDYLPCEIAAIEYSIKRGITKTLHRFIEPGRIPSGYRYQCKSKSEDTHQIPPERFDKADHNYRGLYIQLENFINPNNENPDYPPFYCLGNDVEEMEYCLNWIHGKSCIGYVNRVKKVYTIEGLVQDLFAHIGHSVSETQVIDLLTAHTWDFEPKTRCDYHEELECKFCSLGIINRFAYAMSDSLCALYGCQITAKHLPFRSEGSVACQVLPQSSLRVDPNQDARLPQRPPQNVSRPQQRQQTYQQQQTSNRYPQVSQQREDSDEDDDEDEGEYTSLRRPHNSGFVGVGRGITTMPQWSGGHVRGQAPPSIGDRDNFPSLGGGQPSMPPPGLLGGIGRGMPMAGIGRGVPVAAPVAVPVAAPVASINNNNDKFAGRAMAPDPNAAPIPPPSWQQPDPQKITMADISRGLQQTSIASDKTNLYDLQSRMVQSMQQQYNGTIQSQQIPPAGRGGMFEQFQGILGNLQKDRKLPVGRGYAPPGGIV